MYKSYYKSYLASIFISFIEWFDFIVFIYIFMLLFNNNDNLIVISLFQKIGMLISFFARPLGAFIFGKISTIKGRIPCLINTVYLMLLASILLIFAVLIKEYIYACVAITIIARFMQGMALGGEFTNSVLYIYEIATKKATAIAIAGFGAGLGMTLATYAPNLLSSIKSVDNKIIIAYGLSIVLSIFAIFLRKNMTETKGNQKNILNVNTNKESNLLLSFNIFKYVFPYVFLIYYTLIIFPSHAEKNFKITLEESEYYLTYFSFFTAVIPILFGILADKIGVDKVLKWTNISILFYIPLFVLIKNPIFQINVISLLVSSYWAVALTKLFTKTNINQLYLAFPVLYNIIVAIISTQIVTFFNIGIDHDKVFIVFLIFMFLINIKEIFTFNNKIKIEVR
ncbi:MFS transporter [Silvanigrella sp.]|jgi:MFS family permease|uniref:MFS transporter n=1 Tax=Silvanigrella sp. TaxID=2024976 RepID=UPI0037CA4AE5